jgi:hypothetical protein
MRILSLAVMVVMSTWYQAPGAFNGDLYCTSNGPEYYVAREIPWIAVDKHRLDSGQYECGETVLLVWPNGAHRLAYVLDAGPLEYYHIEGSSLPLAVDVPAWLWPYDLGILSSEVSVIRVESAMPK